MACALQCQDKRDFWDELRFLTNNLRNMPNIVNSAQVNDEIWAIFRNISNDLYNSVSYNSHDMKNALIELDSNIKYIWMN